PGGSELEVDLAPAIDRILEPVEEQLPLEIPRPEDPTVTLATIPDVPLLTGLSAVTPWAQWAGPAALALLVLALLIGAHRRTLLALAGLGGILAGAGVWWLAARIETLVPDAVDQAVFLGPIVHEFESRFQAAMTPQGVILLGAGALVTAVGVVRRDLPQRRCTPISTTPTAVTSAPAHLCRAARRGTAAGGGSEHPEPLEGGDDAVLQRAGDAHAARRPEHRRRGTVDGDRGTGGAQHPQIVHAVTDPHRRGQVHA